jgi:hypothetical protein
MNLETISSIVLGLGVLAWIGYKQLTWRPVGAGMWTMPIVLAAVGLFTLARGGVTTVSGSDVALLGVEFVLSGVVGVVMGLLARFRPISEQGLAKAKNTADRRGGALPTLETRTGILGFALWIVLIAARIAIDVWAAGAGSILASTGVILVMIAANRAARVLVITQRVARHAPVAA